MSYTITGAGLTVEALVKVARHNEPVELHPDALKRIIACRTMLEKKIEAGLPWCESIKGQEMAARGDHAGAAEAFGRAIEGLIAAKATREVDKTRYRLGLTLLATGDSERGRTLLSEAKEGFAKSGAALWVNKCEKALEG